MSHTQITLHDITRIEIGEPKLGSLLGPVYYHRDVVIHSIDGSKTTITVFTADHAEGMPVTINSPGKSTPGVSVTFDSMGITEEYTHV